MFITAGWLKIKLMTTYRYYFTLISPGKKIHMQSHHNLATSYIYVYYAVLYKKIGLKIKNLVDLTF